MSGTSCSARRRRRMACLAVSPSRPERATAIGTRGRSDLTASTPSAFGSAVPMARRSLDLSDASQRPLFYSMLLLAWAGLRLNYRVLRREFYLLPRLNYPRRCDVLGKRLSQEPRLVPPFRFSIHQVELELMCLPLRANRMWCRSKSLARLRPLPFWLTACRFRSMDQVTSSSSPTVRGFPA